MAGPAAQLDEAKRFAEIVAILQKHHLVQGLTPEKVRDIFVDLGPTFVKFGQILSMRSDILPKEYCLALETLRTDVTPMPLTEVEDILTQAYARPWQEVFSDIGIRPLGSASIAQVHAATLTDGQRVVVKVQRPDLYEIMSRDVRLLKRAAVLLKYTPLASALDFHAVLDEIWRTVQEELDFTIEADNIAEFKRLNDGVAYADCPATYPKWCTKNVLVMEYIGGHQIDDAAGLRADPHPGNIRVQDGKIVWLDLGMMGRISPREAELYLGIIRTIYEQDVPALTDTLLSLGQYTRMPDRQALAERIGIFLHKYEAMPMADMDMGVLVDEFVQILNEYGVSVPGSLTMLGRSLLVIQGMLTSVSPDANVIEIVAEYVKNTALSREHIEKKVKTLAQQLARSGEKLTVLPAQLSEFFGKANAGQLTVNVKKSWSDAAHAAHSKLLGRLIFALLDCSLLFCAAITCLAPLPRVLGLPWPALVFFAAAIAMTLALFDRRRWTM